ncbi:hypothetical protein BGZ76_005047, partial [Entomortierella beljakovae]
MGLHIQLKYDDGRTKDIVNLKLPRSVLPYYWKIKRSIGWYCPSPEEQQAILRGEEPKNEQPKN